MLRITKRARCGALAFCGGLLLAGCTVSAPPFYSIHSTGSGGNGPPDNFGAPIDVIPAPVDRQAQVFPRLGGLVPPHPPAEPVMIPPAAPPPITDDPPPKPVPVRVDPPALQFPPLVTPLTPPADARECIGWWRICHFY